MPRVQSQHEASGAAAPGAARQGIEVVLEMKCIRCDRACTVPDSYPTGSNKSTSREHKGCQYIRKAMATRVKKHKGLAHWWKTAKDEDKQDWYCKQVDKNEATGSGVGKKRDWDDTGLEEVLEQGAEKTDSSLIGLETFEMFQDRKITLALAEAGGEPKKAIAALKEEWKRF